MKRRRFLGNMAALAGGHVLVVLGAAGSDEAIAASNVASTASVKAAAIATSTDGTVIPSATSLVDRIGNVWTLANGYIYKNGVKDKDSYNVTLLLWYGGMIYQRGTGGQFYVMTWANRWLPCSDPRIALTAPGGAFYGMNGHYNYPYTPQQIITTLQALGCTSYRVGCDASSTQLNAMIGLADAFRSVGFTLLPLLNYGLRDANGNLYASESAAYNANRAGAAACAQALGPHGITMYECGNELTRDSAIILNSASAGTGPLDFNNTNWPILRGAIQGMIDGVKSVQPNAKCGVNFTVADIGASDMLWDGEQPDGSGGYRKMRWDITTWHNYQPYGDIFEIGIDGAGPGFNLPCYCKARYGTPFMITEWNAAPQESEQFRATYVQQNLQLFYEARKDEGIQAVMYYELISGDETYGIVMNDLAPIQPTYTAFSEFTAANADV
ncbi:hypothetical protein [Trinickia acidisoli]|uniref:hypothetical protein n=1 Tax=Trinickia acidisoli TaxID=2767482 RepID=UPI001A8E82F0|nr:hypothetical protein [Trinickia acidisoli]